MSLLSKIIAAFRRKPAPAPRYPTMNFKIPDGVKSVQIHIGRGGAGSGSGGAGGNASTWICGSGGVGGAHGGGKSFVGYGGAGGTPDSPEGKPGEIVTIKEGVATYHTRKD